MEKQTTFFLRLAGRILGTVAGISIVLVLLGYFLQWNDPVKFSNAFFWTGAIVVVIGLFSVTGGLEQRGNFGITYAETAGDANISQRTQRMMSDVTQRYGSMIFLMLTGLLLIGLAVAIGSLLTSG